MRRITGFIIFAVLFSISVMATAQTDDVSKVEIAVRIPESEFIPEGMAYDPKSGDFFIGSVHECRILRFRTDGTYSEFVPAHTEGLGSVLGMKVDVKRRVLWVNTRSSKRVLAANPEMESQTGVYKFDADSGKFLAKNLVPQDSDRHIFNDLTITEDGDVYATSSAGGKIYMINGKTAEMKELLQLEGVLCNGIDLSEDGRFLYISGNQEIYRVEIDAGKSSELAAPAGEVLGHADGLYVKGNSLVGICHQQVEGEYSAAVRQYYLNDAGDSVVRVNDIVRDHPQFVLPTTGAIVDDKLYFIATSHLDKIDDKGGIKEGAEIGDILIMRVDLE